MVRWFKNMTAAAQVTAEVWVSSLAWHSGLKDPALLQLWLRFNSWPWELPYAAGAAIKTNKQTKSMFK